MAQYRIRNMVSPMELHHIGPEYLTHVKQKMIRDLAAKMFEVFGDLPVKTDPMTGEQYLEFTMNSWENHEVTKANEVAYTKGWSGGAATERLKWQERVAELQAQLAQKETPDLSDRG